jgi:hypothetical protein
MEADVGDRSTLLLVLLPTISIEDKILDDFDHCIYLVEIKLF